MEHNEWEETQLRHTIFKTPKNLKRVFWRASDEKNSDTSNTLGIKMLLGFTMEVFGLKENKKVIWKFWPKIITNLEFYNQLNHQINTCNINIGTIQKTFGDDKKTFLMIKNNREWWIYRIQDVSSNVKYK